MSGRPPEVVGCIPFDRAAAFYETTRAIPPEVIARAVRLIVSDPARRRRLPFLDAGAGTGRFARQLARGGVLTVGVDISHPMLEQARLVAPDLRLVGADLRRMPFGPGRFGGALLVHVLHLIGDWHGVLAETWRVLDRGAPIYLGSEVGRRHATHETYFAIAEERGLLGPRLGAESVDAVVAQLRASGARVERIDSGCLVWSARATRHELLDILRLNPFSDLWHVPDPEHSALLQETEARIRASGAAWDDIDEADTSFALWRITQQ